MGLFIEKMAHKVRGAFLTREKTESVPHSPQPELMLNVEQDASRLLASTLTSMSQSQLYEFVGKLSKEAIEGAFTKDRWSRNYYLNIWEYVLGRDVLESYPWNISLPIADVCNARCTFCDSWLRGEGVLSLTDLENFCAVLPYARLLGIQGHGEPLANPNIDDILRKLNELTDSRCWAYIITNGAFLDSKLDLLFAANVKTYNISLNAVTPTTHDIVMGLGEKALGKILESIDRIRNAHDQKDKQITISLVVTSDNIHEAADFVRLGNDLGVQTIYLRSLMPMSEPPLNTKLPSKWLNYHILPPYLHPKFEHFKREIEKAIAESKVHVEAYPETWAKPIFTDSHLARINELQPNVFTRSELIRDKDLRERSKADRKAISGHGEFVSFVDGGDENPYNREPRFDCRFVYHNLICNEVSFRLNPCCYMPDVPGFKPLVLDSEIEFMTLWNAPAFRTLRRRLREGPLFKECKTCPMQG